MDPTASRLIVQARIASLHAEAAAERLAAAARATRPARPSIRTAIGRRLMLLGAAVAATPLVDDPCADAAANRA